MLFLPGADQREFDRFQTLDYAMVSSKLHKKPFRCEVVDVSLSGLQVTSEHPFAMGEEVELEIGLRKNDELVIHAKVCYTRCEANEGGTFSTGMRFVPHTAEQRAAIARYIHSAFMRETPIVRTPAQKAA